MAKVDQIMEADQVKDVGSNQHQFNDQKSHSTPATDRRRTRSGQHQSIQK